MNNETRTATGLEIAIIGMAGRFPGAKNITELWNNLCEGRESIRFFSSDEIAENGLDEQKAKDPGFIAAHGVLDNYDCFDSDFFDYTPREAEIMDPQHRVFLECVWTGLESAGYNPFNYKGAIGLVASSSQNGYKNDHVFASAETLDLATEFQANVSNNNDFLTTRVSYKLNLTGPSLTVQTACSSSLVAIHLACQQLIAGDCDISVAGGVSIAMPESWGYQHQEGMIFSPDGHCRTFDKEAQGTLKGDGVAVVILKRLEDAIEDGDNIEAVILSSALNNDGNQKIGYTAPSIKGQVDVIRSAQIMAEIPVETIGFIEAHGTGTPLGDPIEIAALTQVFSEFTTKKQFCKIGSIKTNIGHLDAAAGIAGFIKSVLCVKNNKFVPSLNFISPNPEIDFLNSPVKVSTDFSDWSAEGATRRAGVSSFGIGGTNAHIIIEQAPEVEYSQSKLQQHYLIPVSANSKETLDVLSEDFQSFIIAENELQYADIAYMSQKRRKHFSHRCAYIISASHNYSELDKPIKVINSGTAEVEPNIVFLFPGQGAQYAGMGKALYDSEPVYRKWVDYCCESLKPQLDFDLRNLLLNSSDAVNMLQETQYTQPAIFITEYALAKLWISNGIKPEVMIGHSLGEITAACIAGIFTLDHALNLVQLRAKLMQDQPRGGMLSVPLTEEVVLQYLDKDISLAAVNGSLQCVVSGNETALNMVKIRIESHHQIDCTLLKTSHAFHSAMMDSIVQPFVDCVAKIELKKPNIQIISSVSGQKISIEEILDPQYWGKNIRNTVRFNDAIHTAMNDLKSPLFIESGPGTTLTALAKNSVSLGVVPALASLRHPKDNISDVVFFKKSIAECWCHGINLDWNKVSAEGGAYIPLPSYPFRSQRYWICSQERKSKRSAKLSKLTEKDWLYSPSWRRVESISGVDSAHFQSKNLLVISDWPDLIDEINTTLSNSSVQISVVSQSETVVNKGRANYLDMTDKTAIDDFIRDYQFPIEHIILDLQSVHEESFYSLLFVIQALAIHRVGIKIKIDIVTRNAYSVLGNEKMTVAYAPVLSIMQSFLFEYPELHCRHIDIYQGKVFEALIDELFSRPYQRVLALRNQYRWIPWYEKITSPVITKTDNYKEGAVYLITGGMGNLGLLMAEHISTANKACFVLVSRTEFPGREKWETILAADQDQKTCEKIKQLLKIEHNNSKTLLLQADVANLQQIQSVVNQVVDVFGKISIVIHAAGILESSSFKHLADIEVDDFNVQKKPKSSGLQNLNKVLQPINTDLLMTFSSISSIIGGPGYTTYAAANLAMDYVAANKEEGKEWITINWDGWKLFNDDNYEFSIEKQQGLKIFDQLQLITKPCQVIVSTADLNQRIADIEANRERVISTVSEQNNEEAVVDENCIEFSNETEQKISDIWHEILGIKAIGINDNFFDLGGDSLIAIRIISRLRVAFSIEFPASTLFEWSTIKQLAVYIQKTEGTNVIEKVTSQQKITDLKANINEMSADEIRALIKEKLKNKSDNAKR